MLIHSRASGAFQLDDRPTNLTFVPKKVDVLHLAMNPTQVVYSKKIVAARDESKLFLCHGEDCIIFTAQTSSASEGQRKRRNRTRAKAKMEQDRSGQSQSR